MDSKFRSYTPFGVDCTLDSKGGADVVAIEGASKPVHGFIEDHVHIESVKKQNTKYIVCNKSVKIHRQQRRGGG